MQSPEEVTPYSFVEKLLSQEAAPAGSILLQLEEPDGSHPTTRELFDYLCLVLHEMLRVRSNSGAANAALSKVGAEQLEELQPYWHSFNLHVNVAQEAYDHHDKVHWFSEGKEALEDCSLLLPTSNPHAGARVHFSWYIPLSS